MICCPQLIRYTVSIQIPLCRREFLYWVDWKRLVSTGRHSKMHRSFRELENNMKISTDFFLGLSFGIALLLSCGEDSPPRADAMTPCDCPEAEPPVPPRIVEVTNTTTVPPPNLPLEDGRETVGVECPLGSILLQAGCSANDGQTATV